MDQPVKKRKLQAMETRQRIFNATMELINEKGVENVQIEDISRRANISMGLFYRYYSNVYDVMSGVRSSECDAYYKEVRDKYLIHVRGEEKLLQFVGYVIDYHKNLNKSELTLSYVTIMTNDNHKNTIVNEERTIYQILAESLNEMKEDGVLGEDILVDTVVHNLCLLIRGTIFEYIINKESFDAVETAKHIVKAYLKGIK